MQHSRATHNTQPWECTGAAVEAGAAAEALSGRGGTGVQVPGAVAHLEGAAPAGATAEAGHLMASAEAAPRLLEALRARSGASLAASEPEVDPQQPPWPPWVPVAEA